MLIVPLWRLQSYRPQFDRAQAFETAQRWTDILAHDLPANSVLVSNDRDDITPMLYKQYIEKRVPGMTGLFPLISPEPGWEDLNTTLASALATDRPVYTIKAMPGIEALYQTELVGADVYRVLGPHLMPEISFDYPYGSALRWLNIAWSGDAKPGAQLRVTLTWQATQSPPAPWHSFLHLLDAQGEKVAQADDHQPGGDYLPAPLWNPGDIIVDTFTLTLPDDLPPANTHWRPVSTTLPQANARPIH